MTKLKACFLRAGFYGVFGITRDSYDNLVSSGDVNLIKNVHLKRKLSTLYAKDGWSQAAQEGLVIQAIEDYDEYKHNFIDPMMMNVPNCLLPRIHHESPLSLVPLLLRWCDPPGPSNRPILRH